MSTPSATGPSEGNPTSDEVEVNVEIEESAQDTSEDGNLKKKRKFTSKVQDDFTREDLKNGGRAAICKHCKRKFVGKGPEKIAHLKKKPNNMSLVKAQKHMSRTTNTPSF